MAERKWFVGVDWATEEHAVCLTDDGGAVVGERTFAHSGTGLAELCAWLLEASGAEPAALHVAIEVTHGAVVETLLEHGMVVYAINPKQLDRFRDRFTVAGAKDDRRDARVLADSLRTDSQCFRRLRIDQATIIEIRTCSRMLEDNSALRTRLKNQLRQELLRYFAQMLELPQDLSADWFLALLELVTTPEKARRVHEESVAKLLQKHRVRRFNAQHVLATLRQKPLTVAPGVVEAASGHVIDLVEHLRLLNDQRKRALRKLKALIQRLGTEETEPVQGCGQRDAEILRSLPGIGIFVLATLLAEASGPLGERDYHTLRMLCGVAPVTRSSGKRTAVVMRRACNQRLREAMYHWARVAIIHDPKSKATYAASRKKGHSHGRALRGVSDRLLEVACAMLRDGTEYDSSRRLAA